MAKRIGYMFIERQLTLVLNGKAYDVDPGHPAYKEIAARMTRPDGETDEEEAARADKLLSLIRRDRIDLREAAAALGIGDVVIEHGVVLVKGEPIHNSLTKRILELHKAGLPYTSFVRFYVNLSQNPSVESRKALFDFLEQGKFPLTEDGCFLGYKGVTQGRVNGKDTLVDCHSGKFDMSPGNKHSMPWEAVDNNRNSACGAGFHIGTIGHARGHGSVMIVVKCNPKDAVSVPTSDTTKLRACAYEVVNIYSDQKEAQELVKPVYTQEEIESPDLHKNETEYTLRQEPEEERRAEFAEMGRDDICREAARRGIFASTNEARAVGKELVVEALLVGDIPFEKMDNEQIADLAVRRHLFASTTSARKAGRTQMMTDLRADNKVRQDELNGVAPKKEEE